MTHPATPPPAPDPSPVNRLTIIRAACELLYDTAELPGKEPELLAVLGRYRRALHDLLQSDPHGALALTTAELDHLAATYPSFRFARHIIDGKGRRWIAERKDRQASGLRVIITDDIAELREALRQDGADHVR